MSFDTKNMDIYKEYLSSTNVRLKFNFFHSEFGSFKALLTKRSFEKASFKNLENIWRSFESEVGSV